MFEVPPCTYRLVNNNEMVDFIKRNMLTHTYDMPENEDVRKGFYIYISYFYFGLHLRKWKLSIITFAANNN